MPVKPPIVFEERHFVRKSEPVLKDQETVANLLSLYKGSRITRDQLLDAFLTRVTWEFRGIEGPLEWKAENTWATVWEAQHQGILSHEDYMFLAMKYEERMQDN